MSSVMRMVAVALFLLSALPGCTSSGALSNRALEFNEVFAQAADSQLLLNIVRAAYRNPTRYTAVSLLREARTAQGSFTLGGQSQFSPHKLTGYSIGPSTTATGTQQPSFDVAPLDDRKAVLGLYRPVDPQTLFSYWQQNWPRAALLFLLVDDVILTQAVKDACGLKHDQPDYVDGKPYYRLDNSSYTRKDFDDFLKFYDCIRGKLTLVETKEAGTILQNSPVPPAEIVKSLPELAKSNFAVKETSEGGKRLYTISKPSKGWQFNLTLGGSNMLLSIAGSTTPKEAAVTFHLRSVDGIVYYLGELLRLQLSGESALVPFGRDEWATLFHVERNASPESGDRIEVEFLGERFAVSRQPKKNDFTLTVMSLVSQLFSLYREGTELPRTVAVQLLSAP